MGLLLVEDYLSISDYQRRFSIETDCTPCLDRQRRSAGFEKNCFFLECYPSLPADACSNVGPRSYVLMAARSVASPVENLAAAERNASMGLGNGCSSKHCLPSVAYDENPSCSVRRYARDSTRSPCSDALSRRYHRVRDNDLDERNRPDGRRIIDRMDLPTCVFEDTPVDVRIRG